jgi:phospholipid/cholesterol/gamma-HCH transport system substrate-binding protein
VSTKIPKTGALVTLACFLVGLALFFAFNASFGGPSPIPAFLRSEPYELRATFPDAEGVLPKSLVLARGVEVGKVSRVEVHGASADVFFEVDEHYAPIFRDATARLGRRTVFGEAFVDLDPGSRRAGELPAGATVRPLPTVTIDQALAVLDDERRDHLEGILGTVERASRSPHAVERINATYGSLHRAVGSVRALTEELRYQERDIAGLVEGSRRTVTALGDREEALRRIVGSGRVTLEAVAAQRAPLDDTLVEAPRLLATARSALAHSRPLLAEARPLVRDLRLAAPELELAARDLPPTSRDAAVLIDRLPPLRRAAVPALGDALPAVRALRPVAPELTPATANLVSVGRHLEAQGRCAALVLRERRRLHPERRQRRRLGAPVPVLRRAPVGRRAATAGVQAGKRARGGRVLQQRLPKARRRSPERAVRVVPAAAAVQPATPLTPRPTDVRSWRKC